MADTDPGCNVPGRYSLQCTYPVIIYDCFYDKTLKAKYGIAKRLTYNGKDTDIINGLAFSVSANTNIREEATDFALWLGSEEAQKINGEAGVCISARNDCQQYFVDAIQSAFNRQIFLLTM